MRTITTVEALDALPVGAVIKDSYGESGWVYELTDGGDWATTGSEGYYSPDDITLPATLLHPLRFDAADVEKAARAMDESYNPDQSPILAAMFQDYARAVLATIGEVQG